MSRVLHWPIVFICSCFSVVAQASNPSEYEIKAAFLFNFAKYVTWAKPLPGAGQDEFVFGIVGDVPKADFQKTLAGATLDGRPVKLRFFDSVDGLEPAHVIFIAQSEIKRTPKVLELMKKMPSLTVSDENDQFLDLGGVINFKTQLRPEAKIRFEINNTAAEDAGLQINSKLLKLAIRVEDKRLRR